jgi:hypothetical protein
MLYALCAYSIVTRCSACLTDLTINRIWGSILTLYLRGLHVYGMFVHTVTVY